MGGKKKTAALLRCAICGKDFRGLRPGKYCSVECRKKAKRIRNANKRCRDGNLLLYMHRYSNDMKGCRGCSHYDEAAPCCQYIVDNGRVRPCAVQPDGGCEMYTPSVRNSYEAGLDIWDWDEAKAWELLDSGMNVFEVAATLGASPNSVKAMIFHGNHGSHSASYDRGNENFNAQLTNRRKRFNEEEYRKLYARGLTDAKAAKEMGLSEETIRKRRKKLGLPACGRPWGKPGANRPERQSGTQPQREDV